ncbi:protein of unknown function [Methylacidimicrobium sp. AP8]|nr:protein of unknown function [Methylacidimicrobium sp. AP8]
MPELRLFSTRIMKGACSGPAYTIEQRAGGKRSHQTVAAVASSPFSCPMEEKQRPPESR